MPSQEMWLAISAFFVMISSLTILVATLLLAGWIKVLKSMITDARSLGFVTPEDRSRASVGKKRG